MCQPTPLLAMRLLCLSFNNCKMGVDSSYLTGLSQRLHEAVHISAQKMLIVVFVVINNEEEEAVVLNERYTSESPGALSQNSYAQPGQVY